LLGGISVMKLSATKFLAIFVIGIGFAPLLRAQQAVTVASASTAQTEARPVSTAVDEGRPVPGVRYPRYRICLGDVMDLSFPLSPELNQKLTVQPDGYVTLTGAGSIHVVGLTVPEVTESVKKAYAKMLHDPIVDVDLATFQKPSFVVLGQVGKPGQYELRSDLTLTEAVAVAGGFAPTAKTEVMFFRQVSSNWAEVKKIKINDLLNGKNLEEVHIQPGDMIFVPEKSITKFRKYVPYSFGMSFNPAAVAY